MIFRITIPASLRVRAGAMEVRLSIASGESVTFDLRDGEALEVIDPLAIAAVRSLHGLYGITVTELGTRPPTVQHDVDAKPRTTRPNGARV